jgi:hypothetical protein
MIRRPRIRRNGSPRGGQQPPESQQADASGAEVVRQEPDEVATAALEAVSEAVELGDENHRLWRLWRGRRPSGRPGGRATGPLTGRLAGEAKGIRRIGAALATAARRGARVTGRGASAGGKWLSDQVLAMAPRLPVRNLSTLRSQFPARTPDELAEALVDRASRASAAVGVAVGTWAVLPFMPAAGVEIATETLAVVGIEIKLVAELHEAYGLTPPGGIVDRMTGFVGSWAERRGVGLAPGGLVIAAGSPIARQLQRRLAARAGRSVFSLAPLLTGAAAGGLINRRETRKLGRLLIADLRKRTPYVAGWPD